MPDNDLFNEKNLLEDSLVTEIVYSPYFVNRLKRSLCRRKLTLLPLIPTFEEVACQEACSRRCLMCEKSFGVYPFILCGLFASCTASRILANELTVPYALFVLKVARYSRDRFCRYGENPWTLSDRFTLVDLANNIMRRGRV